LTKLITAVKADRAKAGAQLEAEKQRADTEHLRVVQLETLLQQLQQQRGGDVNAVVLPASPRNNGEVAQLEKRIHELESKLRRAEDRAEQAETALSQQQYGASTSAGSEMEVSTGDDIGGGPPPPPMGGPPPPPPPPPKLSNIDSTKLNIKKREPGSGPEVAGGVAESPQKSSTCFSVLLRYRQTDIG
jgi:hypothetical protein